MADKEDFSGSETPPLKELERVMQDMYYDSNSMNIRITRLDSKLDSLSTREDMEKLRSDIQNFKIDFWRKFGLRVLGYLFGLATLIALIMQGIQWLISIMSSST